MIFRPTRSRPMHMDARKRREPARSHGYEASPPVEHVRDFRCEEAVDGETALARIREDPPDLVFLDVMLPGISGIDVLGAVRDDPALRNVAVVVVSAWQGPDDVAAALKSGADGFLEKPFLVDDLASLARDLAGRHR